jgi:CRP-like cAMP-binding protein
VATTSALAQARSQLLRQVRRLYRHAGVQSGHAMTRTELLGNLALFESLTPGQIDELAAQLGDHVLDPGETLFEEGSVGQSLYIVCSGIFEVSRREHGGARFVVGRIGPGEYLGEISMMSGDPRPATVTALTIGRVVELPRSAIETLLGEDKALAAALERSVRSGLLRLDRDAAARECHPLDQSGSLLGRIRSFLRVPPRP